jgi:acetoin utilization protein AcuB
MLMPAISRYMTAQPWTIRHDAKLSEARSLMREHAIRHLPVLDGGRLVGILSERDIYMLERFPVFDEGHTVEDAMTQDVYTVHGDDPVDSVVEAMAQRKYGSAVVLNRRDSIEGIFTSVDAMQVFVDVVRRATA